MSEEKLFEEILLKLYNGKRINGPIHIDASIYVNDNFKYVKSCLLFTLETLIFNLDYLASVHERVDIECSRLYKAVKAAETLADLNPLLEDVHKLQQDCHW